MNMLKKATEKVLKVLNIFKGGFSVSSRILDHFGIQAYDSIKKSLVELVSNSYDADATEVHIDLPDRIVENSEITLKDNGIGMSTKEFQENYLQIGRDRRIESDCSPKGRKVIGNKGIGKLAGFGIAGLITVETYKNGIKTVTSLKREEFNKNKDLEDTKFDIQTYQLKDASLKGTTIILKELKQDLSVPKKDFLRRYLRNNLPKYEEDFKIFVNDIECTAEDILGDKHEINETIDSLDKSIKGYYIITKANQADPGLAVRVRGRLVTKPGFFNLPFDSFTANISRKFTGELYADFLDEGNGSFQSLINTSRTGFIEENKVVEKFNAWVKDFLKKILKKESKKHLTGQTNNILKTPTIESRLNSLPAPVRGQAKDMIAALVSKMKEREDQDIIQFAGLILQYFESNILQELLDKILSADSNDVERLAELISAWGVREVVGVAELIKRYIQIIKKLGELINKTNTSEKQIHKLFEKNLWLLNDQYKLWESNKTLKTILGDHLDKNFAKQKHLRPDLVCLTHDDKVVVIEFKSPQVTISLSDFTQTLQYKSLIEKHQPNTSEVFIYLIGKQYDASITTIKAAQEKAGNFLISYSEVLANAERKFNDILKILQKK